MPKILVNREGGDTIFYTKVAGVATEIMRVTQAGVVTTGSPSSGVIFAAGTEALPAITFTGDTNTGLYLAAADTIGISTSGKEKCRINSSGYFGLGDKNPEFFATITDPSTNAVSDVALLSLKGLGTGATGSVGIIFGYKGVANYNKAGIFFDADNSGYGRGSLVFATTSTTGPYTVTASDAKMVIDISGNVGIGETNPTDTSSFSRALDMKGTNGAALYCRSTTNPTTEYGLFGFSQTAVYVWNQKAAPMYFGTAGLTRMIIGGSTGYVGIGMGETAPSYNFHISASRSSDNVAYINNTSATQPSALRLNFSGAAPNNTSETFLMCVDTTAQRCIIYSNGNIVNQNGSYGTISDVSLKENIVDATPKLEDLLNVRIRNFNFINDPNLKQIGVIAQELESVFPSLVTVNGNGLKEVKSSIFIPILIKTIQEQQAIIEALTERVSTLEQA